MMTLKQLESTPWAKSFKYECSEGYKQAIIYAMDEDMEVEVVKTNELGYWCWAIVVIGTDFWMETKLTKKDAVALCKQMTWKI